MCQYFFVADFKLNSDLKNRYQFIQIHSFNNLWRIVFQVALSKAIFNYSNKTLEKHTNVLSAKN